MKIPESQLGNIIEAILFASSEPMSPERIQKIFTPQEKPDMNALKNTLKQLQEKYEHAGIELKELATGYRFQVRADHAEWVGRLWEEKPPRYSRALLETLILIAYRQPITRAEIEEVRGVAVSTGIVKTLLDREWVRVVGHRDVPGRPSLYGTTKAFLDYFNLQNLSELPTLAELQALNVEEKEASLQLELAINDLAAESEKVQEEQTDDEEMVLLEDLEEQSEEDEVVMLEDLEAHVVAEDIETEERKEEPVE